MKRLAQLSGAPRLRFWGKIYGTDKDYLIVEGALENYNDGTDDLTIEKRGTGVNKYVYWVTDSVLEDWMQLPDLKSEHLIGAKNIKHIFTGRLNAVLDCNP